VPGRAIPKDTRFIGNQLKQRRLSFSNKVNLSAPAEGFDRQVKIVKATAEATTLEIAGTLVDES
jgi:hypothetical protein